MYLKNPITQKWLAFYIYLLDKVDILTETSYRYVVFGTAAKNLKEHRLWIRFHTMAEAPCA